MGAIVTIKTKPGTNLVGLREKIQKAIADATGEHVNVIISKVEAPRAVEIEDSIQPSMKPRPEAEVFIRT